MTGGGVIALTGATGFIGRALLDKLLAEGYRVRALVRRNTLPNHPNLEVVRGDISSQESLKNLCAGASVVLHCAGLTKSLSKENLFEVNAFATHRLFRQAEAAGVKRLLYVSSLAAREPKVSLYASSKYQGEQGAKDVRDLGWDILRPPAVYGPGDTQFLVFFKMLQNNLAVLTASPEAKISMIYVDDLVGAIYAWLTSKTSTQRIYELSGPQDDGFTFKEIFQAGAKTLNTRPVYIRPPVPLLYLTGWISLAIGKITGRPPLLSPDKIGELRHNDWQVHENNFEENNFETNFGWSPKIKLEIGFDQTARWYYQQGWLKQKA